MTLQRNDHDDGAQPAISSHAWALVSLAILLLCGAGCATAGPIQSQVLDAQTGQPVSGAIVLGVWTKRVGLGEHHTELVGVNEVEVDAQGRFVLPRPRGHYDEERITVYKFGYVAWSNHLLFPSLKRRPEQQVPLTIPLELFPPAESHREHMMFIRSATSSVLFGLSDNPKFYNATYREDRM